MTWWQRLWNRDRLERELDAELQFHVDRLVDDNMRAGMAADQARRRARLEFGGLEQLKEQCRDARSTRWAHDVIQDVRFAARLLTKDRAFSALAIMALALGIGVTSMFFTIVNALCLRGPLGDPAGLVHLGTRDDAGVAGGISHADFTDIQPAVQALAGLGAYAVVPLALGDEQLAAERVTGAYVFHPALRLLGERPVLGRDFAPEDDRAGAPPVAILAAGLWKRRYSADAGVIGRTVRIDGAPTAVIGVMREGFGFPNDAEIWLPLAAMPHLANQPRNARTLGVFGRLAEGGTIAGAQVELDGIARRLQHEHPRTNDGIRLTVVPINERFTGRITDPAWMAFITAGTLVLLIACANVANLLLARAVRRSGEMAVRTSLGANRARIVRQLLVECSLLAIAAGCVGLLLSFAGTHLLSAAIPEGALPSWMHLTMDGWVLAALVGICLGTVFVFGFVPALYTSRTSVPHVLRNQGRTHADRTGARRWTTVFLSLQFALTFVLLAAVVQSLRSPRVTDDILIDPTNVLTAWITLPAQKYGDSAARTRFYEQLLQEASGIADVSSTSLASALPFGRASPRRVAVEGRDSDRLEAASTVGTIAIAGRYFETLGVGVLHGRDFTEEDGTPGHDVVIINQRFAQVYFRDEDPLGQRIRLLSQNATPEPAPWLTIVGVSPNIPQGGGPDAAPRAYRPFRGAAPTTAALIVRGRSDPAGGAATLRDRVRRLDPDLPLYRTMTMERVISDAGWNPRISSAIIHTVSAIALVLAIIGLYGVTAHGVAARVREIGVRVALGARPRHVRWLVLRRALFQLGFGILAGTAFTIVWNRLFIVSSAADAGSQFVVLATVAILIVGVGVIACLLPARHAVRLDPLAALRCE